LPIFLFYQVFDRGFMRDGEGREIDFRNTVILLTSNLGSETLLQLATPPQAEAAVEQSAVPETSWQPPDDNELLEAIKPALLARFAPSLLARMQVVPFRPLEIGRAHV